VTECLDILVVVLDHVAHIGAVELRPAQLRQPVADLRVLRVQVLRQLDTFAAGNAGQLLVGAAVVVHHADAELLDVLARGVLLGELAELDLGHAADRGLLHEIHVLLAQLLLGQRRAHPGGRLLGESRQRQQERGGRGRKKSKAGGHGWPLREESDGFLPETASSQRKFMR